ncbi:MAG: carbohydrate ABC transporter permease, partial [Clostridia bacterium]|nr:carbohydrate ABC transporter permease [Clostridia bacterium]
MTVVSKRAGHSFRLNQISRRAEAGFHLILGLFALACIIPFVFVIIISFSSEDSIRRIGYSFLPAAWSLDAYKQVLSLGDALWRSYFNSFFITIVGTLVSVTMCVLYAYPLYRKDYKFRGFFSFISFFTMIFGGGLIPTYIVCKNLLGMSNNYYALIVPMLVSPFNIIIMRTFFQTSVPFDLIEAATIDGSGEYSTFFRVVLPIAKPGLATIALLNSLAYWNDWYLSLLYIKQNKVLQPLQALLMELQNNVEYLNRMSAALGSAAIQEAARAPTQTLRMALVVLIVVPIACAYPFFQQYIVAGLTVG